MLGSGLDVEARAPFGVSNFWAWAGVVIWRWPPPPLKPCENMAHTTATAMSATTVEIDQAPKAPARPAGPERASVASRSGCPGPVSLSADMLDAPAHVRGFVHTERGR